MEEKTAAATTSSAVPPAVAALGEPQLLAAAALGACAGERTTTLMTEIKGVGTGGAMPTQRVPAIPDVAAAAADASRKARASRLSAQAVPDRLLPSAEDDSVKDSSSSEEQQQQQKQQPEEQAQEQEKHNGQRGSSRTSTGGVSGEGRQAQSGRQSTRCTRQISDDDWCAQARARPKPRGEPERGVGCDETRTLRASRIADVDRISSWGPALASKPGGAPNTRLVMGEVTVTVQMWLRGKDLIWWFQNLVGGVVANAAVEVEGHPIARVRKLQVAAPFRGRGMTLLIWGHVEQMLLENQFEEVIFDSACCLTPEDMRASVLDFYRKQGIDLDDIEMLGPSELPDEGWAVVDECHDAADGAAAEADGRGARDEMQKQDGDQELSPLSLCCRMMGGEPDEAPDDALRLQPDVPTEALPLQPRQALQTPPSSSSSSSASSSSADVDAISSRRRRRPSYSSSHSYSRSSGSSIRNLTSEKDSDDSYGMRRSSEDRRESASSSASVRSTGSGSSSRGPGTGSSSCSPQRGGQGQTVWEAISQALSRGDAPADGIGIGADRLQHTEDSWVDCPTVDGRPVLTEARYTAALEDWHAAKLKEFDHNPEYAAKMVEKYAEQGGYVAFLLQKVEDKIVEERDNRFPKPHPGAALAWEKVSKMLAAQVSSDNRSEGEVRLRQYLSDDEGAGEQKPCVCWLPGAQSYMMLVCIDGRKVQLWTSSRKQIAQSSTGAVPKMRLKKTFAPYYDKHDQGVVHSITASSDGETFLTADELKIKIWNHRTAKETIDYARGTTEKACTDCYVALDLSSTEEVEEIITAVTFHPRKCAEVVVAFNTGRLSIWNADRTRKWGEPERELEHKYYDDPTNDDYYSDILSVISFVGFTDDGRYLAVRDLMTVQIWDTELESKRPRYVVNVHEHMRSKLDDMFDDGSIFAMLGLEINPAGAKKGDARTMAAPQLNGDMFTFDVEDPNHLNLLSWEETQEAVAVLWPELDVNETELFEAFNDVAKQDGGMIDRKEFTALLDSCVDKWKHERACGSPEDVDVADADNDGPASKIHRMPSEDLADPPEQAPSTTHRTPSDPDDRPSAPNMCVRLQSRQS